MSSRRSRNSSGRSRLANPGLNKKQYQRNTVFPRHSCEAMFLGDGESVDNSPREDSATHSLSPLDLNFAPFKIESTEDPVLEHNTALSILEPFSNELMDEETMEDVSGMPTRAQWKTLVDSYLESLHPSKRHKSLISQEVYDMIFRTLRNPDATRLGTPQFRFWARKMFQLVEAPNDPDVLVVTNGGRPVAIKEHIYDILCMCHYECGHGGRDKTCKVLREYYTWVPKELISNFVKVCPTCEPRRAMALKAKDRKFTSDIGLTGQEESSTSSSRFSVERLEDFGQLPSPYPEQAHQLGHPPLNTNMPSSSTPYPSHFDVFTRGCGPEISLAPSDIVTAHLSPSSLPSPPWPGSIVLPPLMAGQQGAEAQSIDADSHVSRNVVLPPLMQYLSRNRADGNGRHNEPVKHQAQAAHIPIDPALLISQEKSSALYGGNALQLELHPPSPQNATHQGTQLRLDPSFSRLSSSEARLVMAFGGFPSISCLPVVEGSDAEDDNSALLSASTVSFSLPTPSTSGQISPFGPNSILLPHPFEGGSQYEARFGGITHIHALDSAIGLGTSNERKSVGKLAIGSVTSGSPPLFSPLPTRAESTNAILELTAAVSGSDVGV